MPKVREKLLRGVTVATPEESMEYFQEGDRRWAETLTGDDSPTGEPIIIINDEKFRQAGAEGYREKMVLAEALHLLKKRDPERYSRIAQAATEDEQYMAWAERSYEHETKQGEKRPFEKWHEVSRLDQVIGGYIFAEDPSIPTMRNWKREQLPMGSKMRNELESLRRDLQQQPVARRRGKTVVD